MPKLERVEGRSRGSRRLRGTSLGLGLLDGLGLVSWALLVTASPSTISSSTLASSLTITLLLFEGWLIWPALDSAQLLSLVSQGRLSSSPLFPGKSYRLAYV